MQCSYHTDQNLRQYPPPIWLVFMSFVLSCLAPDDYTVITTVLTFTDTVTTQSLSINIVDDLVFEPTEHFNISLSTSSDGCDIPPGNAIVPVYVMDNGETIHTAHTYKIHIAYNKLH